LVSPDDLERSRARFPCLEHPTHVDVTFARFKGHLDATTTTLALEVEGGFVILRCRIKDMQIRVTTTRTRNRLREYGG
jgi:hypothetical protein